MPEALIVEDSKFFQKIIENELRELDYNTVCVSNLSEAREQLRSNKRFHIVTIDIELPDGSGYDLCREIKEDPKFSYLQPIIITSTTEKDSRKKAFDSGAIAYIEKDAVQRLLKNYIKNILSIINNISYSNNWVILLEDSDFQRKYMKSILEFAGLKVIDFKDNKSLLTFLEDERPVVDLALLDYFLESGTSLETISYLRSSKMYEQVPVITLTVSNELSHKYEIFMMGANDFILKPFDTGDFYLRIRNQLRTKYLLDMLDAKNKLLMISSITDELTKLYNRRFFWENLEKEAKRHNRTNSEYSIIMLDIDHFKMINDKYGHSTGDLVLSDVAFTIKNAIRNTDVVARYGGEEFIVLLPDTKKENALKVGEKILNAIRDIPVNFRKAPITTSAGLASSSERDHYEKVIALADERLYKAKNNGRNRIEYD
ncbi:MAG: diguanylate cyclase [Calditerrivibrio sp.]|nr:diguanylate cyclase [Calditerrivibrio sp.]